MRRRSPRQVSEREMTHLARRSAAINELLRLDGGDQSQRESETQGHGGCCCVVGWWWGLTVAMLTGVCWVDDRSTEVALARDGRSSHTRPSKNSTTALDLLMIRRSAIGGRLRLPLAADLLRDVVRPQRRPGPGLVGGGRAPAHPRMREPRAARTTRLHRRRAHGVPRL